MPDIIFPDHLQAIKRGSIVCLLESHITLKHGHYLIAILKHKSPSLHDM